MGGIEKTMNKELITMLEPGGKFELDWQETEEQIDRSQILFQEELYRRFMENAEKALLFLGFSEPSIPMSESLRYLRLLAASFVRNLSRNPEVEVLREKTVVEVEAEDIEHFLRSSPFLNGVEHLNQNWIENVWNGLNYTFSREIQNFRGSVAEFFSYYSPNVHLVGRVFFHLVESKKEEMPRRFPKTASPGICRLKMPL